jgi:hypothetical protein|tara:strand:- start:96 stop:377 length:282 start_codon:yes stop_codon:yes gene_type:complete
LAGSLSTIIYLDPEPMYDATKVNITAAINENIVQHMLQGDGNGPLLEDGTGIRVESPCKLLPTIRGVFEDVSSMSSVLSTKSVIVESTDGECC